MAPGFNFINRWMENMGWNKNCLDSIQNFIQVYHYGYNSQVNLNTNLSTFNTIKPCGLDVEACNLNQYIDISIDELTSDLIHAYTELVQAK